MHDHSDRKTSRSLLINMAIVFLLALGIALLIRS